MSDMWERSRPEAEPPTTENGRYQSLPSRGRGVLNAEDQDFVHDFESRIIANLFISREAFLRSLSEDSRRDLYDEAGYPSTGFINPQLYQNLYEREALAYRAVRVWPKECWQVHPLVYEDEDPEILTPFEKSWKEMCQGLRTQGSLSDSPAPGQEQSSYYEDDEGSVLWEFLSRADELSRIGQYGVVLLGLDDTKDGDLSKPAKFRDGRKLLFLRAFPESMAMIAKIDDRPGSPRYGQPTEYALYVQDTREGAPVSAVASRTLNVHWSRCLHVADNLASSEVYGVPCLRPVLNNILGLKKLYCAAPEMYYKGAFYGISFESHPNLGTDADIDKTELRNMLQDYQNGLQRYLALTGMSAKILSPTVVDPTPNIDRQIDATAIGLDIPKRKLIGSERGELSNLQDETDWSDRLRGRQKNYINPRIIAPLADRLINLGVVKAPKKSFKIWWPDISTQSGDEKAAMAMKLTQALAQYIASGAESVVPVIDFFVNFLGFKEEAALAIIARARELQANPDSRLTPETAPGGSDTPPPSTGTDTNPNIKGKGPNPSGKKQKDTAPVPQTIRKDGTTTA